MGFGLGWCAKREVYGKFPLKVAGLSPATNKCQGASAGAESGVGRRHALLYVL